jgi:hypothetical protein
MSEVQEEKVIFNDEEVRILNTYQEAGKYHPYTCPNDGDEDHIAYEYKKKFSDFYVGFIPSDYDVYLQQQRDKGIPYPEMEFTQTSLIATHKGWICPCCDYTQTHVHPGMLGSKPNSLKK